MRCHHRHSLVRQPRFAVTAAPTPHPATWRWSGVVASRRPVRRPARVDFAPSLASSLLPQCSELTRRHSNAGLLLMIVAMAVVELRVPADGSRWPPRPADAAGDRHWRRSRVFDDVPGWSDLGRRCARDRTATWVLLTGDLVIRGAASPLTPAPEAGAATRAGCFRRCGGRPLVPLIVVRLLWRWRARRRTCWTASSSGVLSSLVFTGSVNPHPTCSAARHRTRRAEPAGGVVVLRGRRPRRACSAADRSLHRRPRRRQTVVHSTTDHRPLEPALVIATLLGFSLTIRCTRLWAAPTSKEHRDWPCCPGTPRDGAGDHRPPNRLQIATFTKRPPNPGTPLLCLHVARSCRRRRSARPAERPPAPRHRVRGRTPPGDTRTPVIKTTTTNLPAGTLIRGAGSHRRCGIG